MITSRTALALLVGVLEGFGIGFILGKTRADRFHAGEVAGEKNLTSAIFVNTLVHLRKGRHDEAFSLLETALDKNVVYVGENLPAAESTTNILNVVRRYRLGYPQ